MKYLSAICLSAAICFSGNIAHAQGDSDPGLSTIGAMRANPDLMIADDDYENHKTHFGIGTAFSEGEGDTRLIMPQAEIRVPLESFGIYGYFDIKLPFHVALGDIANTWNVGDLFVAYTHEIRPEYRQDWTYQLTAGTRIGLTTADQQDIKIRSLPMVYQSSLGTTDLIVGAHAKYKNFFVVSVGFQQPVFQYNENGYDRRAVNNDLLYSTTAYTVGRKLYRYGDAMLRAEGMYSGKRAGFSAGPLLFYHISDDLYTDRLGRDIEIEGSGGLTMNGVGNAYVRFGRRAEIKIDVTGSYPIFKRDIAPDGLRRDAWIMPRFTYFFGQRTVIW